MKQLERKKKGRRRKERNEHYMNEGLGRRMIKTTYNEQKKEKNCKEDAKCMRKMM